MNHEVTKLNIAKGKYLENRRKLDEERNKALEKAVRNEIQIVLKYFCSLNFQ